MAFADAGAMGSTVDNRAALFSEQAEAEARVAVPIIAKPTLPPRAAKRQLLPGSLRRPQRAERGLPANNRDWLKPRIGPAADVDLGAGAAIAADAVGEDAQGHKVADAEKPTRPPNSSQPVFFPVALGLPTPGANATKLVLEPTPWASSLRWKRPQTAAPHPFPSLCQTVARD